MNISPKQILGQLIKNGNLTQDLADKLEVESLQKNISIYDYLIADERVHRTDVLKAAAEVFQIQYVDLTSVPIDPQALSLVSESIARRYAIIPYKYDSGENTLYIATADPFDTSLVEFLERKIQKKVVLTLAAKDDILQTLTIAYTKGLSPEVSEALEEYKPTTSATSKERPDLVVKEAPIAKIVSTILEFAIRGRASDIHIEPQELKTRVRYRIDGVLVEKLILPKSIHEGVVSRIKILSELKIDERRIPQDGRFNFKLGDDDIDLRVSTLPTVFGEKIVMRILKKSGGIPNLKDLGLRGPQLKDLEEAIVKPYGIVLVTGPTGSGKTTTLYSVLSRLNSPTVNIVTLEDPVEYQIPGINQVQINPQAGLTFATGLRSFLRQDPNIILVGEIRDKETTQLAIQAALTGHLVFSTLHTNDSATAIPRLIDLGGEPFLIASVLAVSLAQRIVRRNCQHCRETYDASAEVVHNIKDILGELTPQVVIQSGKLQLTRGRGCRECGDSGYRGRIAIFEILKMTPSINKMVFQNASAKEIETQAKREGLITMTQDGYLKVIEGLTTIEEVLRVSET